MLGENEIWKDIKGYEGFYQISNLGRVKRLKRWNPGKRIFVECESLVAETNNGYGYLIVSLVKEHRRKNHYVHRLVAETFVENPLNKNCVNHLDCNKKNNIASNLEWVTQRENVLYSVDRLRKPKSVSMTNTGERYISLRKRDNRYRVTVNYKEYGRFKTLEEAIIKRDAVLREVGYV